VVLEGLVPGLHLGQALGQALGLGRALVQAPVVLWIPAYSAGLMWACLAEWTSGSLVNPGC